MDIGITVMNGVPAALAPYEMAERKGVGHPDSVCDALAEAFSRALTTFYVERFGAVLHHNVDKALLVAGAARPSLGGGEVLAPIAVYLAGRAVTSYRGVTVPVEEIAIESSRRWLRDHLHALDAERHVRIHALVRPVSADLGDLFSRPGAALANDTSFGAGYAPLDDLERTVLATTRCLNEPATRAACPAIGEDVKVMGVRRDRAIRLTVACALVGRHLESLGHYFRVKSQVRALVLAAARDTTELPVDAEVNVGDGATDDSVYITVTGTSAEAGDDGQVGRGNRVNGLITPYRPMTLEAAAGKNAVTHVGKLYNVAAHRIARTLAGSLRGIAEAHCCLVSQIGRPIDEPGIVDVKVRPEPGTDVEALQPRMVEVVREELGALESYWRRMLAGEFALW
jgi:S-adenosylmethionine synthetase